MKGKKRRPGKPQELGRMRAEVDDEYAFEKLRLMAEEVSGRKIMYIEEGVLK